MLFKTFDKRMIALSLAHSGLRQLSIRDDESASIRLCNAFCLQIARRVPQLKVLHLYGDVIGHDQDDDGIIEELFQMLPNLEELEVETFGTEIRFLSQAGQLLKLRRCTLTLRGALGQLGEHSDHFRQLTELSLLGRICDLIQLLENPFKGCSLQTLDIGNLDRRATFPSNPESHFELFEIIGTKFRRITSMTINISIRDFDLDGTSGSRARAPNLLELEPLSDCKSVTCFKIEMGVTRFSDDDVIAMLKWWPNLLELKLETDVKSLRRPELTLHEPAFFSSIAAVRPQMTELSLGVDLTRLIPTGDLRYRFSALKRLHLQFSPIDNLQINKLAVYLSALLPETCLIRFKNNTTPNKARMETFLNLRRAMEICYAARSHERRVIGMPPTTVILPLNR
jgi:hypothetical protein